MIVKADAKIVIKRSSTATEVPTVAPSDDHTDGAWSDLDIYSGELFVNEADCKLFIRIDSAIEEISLMGGAADNIYTTDGTTGTTRVVTITDTLEFFDGTFIIQGGSGVDILTLQNSAGTIDYWKLDSTGQITMSGKNWVSYSIAGSRFDIGDVVASADFKGTKLRIIPGFLQVDDIVSINTFNTGVERSTNKNYYKANANALSAATHHEFDVIGSTHANSTIFVIKENANQLFHMSQDGSVIFGSGTVNASALLEVESTTKGFRLKPMTGAQAALITPAEGLMLTVSDNTDVTFNQIGLWCYEAGAWAKK